MPVNTKIIAGTGCINVSTTFWMATELLTGEILPLRLTSQRLITDQLLEAARIDVRELVRQSLMERLLHIVKHWLDAGMAPKEGEDIKNLTIPIRTIYLLRLTTKEREVVL